MKKNNNTGNVVLEYMWLVLFILTGSKGIIDTIKISFHESYMFFIMSFLSLILYLARRSLRIKNQQTGDR